MNSTKTIIVYGFILVLTLFALFLIKALNISYPLSVYTTSKSSELAVVGEGKVDVIPDTTTVEVGVTISDGSSVNAVKKTLNDSNNKIVEAMRNLGIKKEDIKTTNFSINQNYSYENNVNKINGYNGNARLSIKVKSVDLAARVMEEATNAGANEVYTTQFYVENPEKYREEARNKAIQNAKDQAEKLAQSLGIRLGKVVNIVESSPQSFQIYPQKAIMSAPEGRGGAADIEPGSQTLTSTVTLFFEKK